MKSLIKEKLEITREVFSKDDAIDFFSKEDQSLKIELIKGFPQSEEISCYKQGEFIDLCRGPHIKNTSEIPPFFKILNVAGAYWKGDENNVMLQRLYAVSFKTKQELKSHLYFLEEAKKETIENLEKN